MKINFPKINHIILKSIQYAVITPIFKNIKLGANINISMHLESADKLNKILVAFAKINLQVVNTDNKDNSPLINLHMEYVISMNNTSKATLNTLETKFSTFIFESVWPYFRHDVNDILTRSNYPAFIPFPMFNQSMMVNLQKNKE
ncbi:MAG: hypothetical protein OEY59_09005 [Deltaproteobacteria bacterium]|nr:hypothetical protein [Deltaproteobacteria bacterium]